MSLGVVLVVLTLAAWCSGFFCGTVYEHAQWKTGKRK